MNKCQICGKPAFLKCRRCQDEQLDFRGGGEGEAAFVLAIGWLVLLSCIAAALWFGNYHAV